jgi:hypothetical protein
MIDLGQFEGVIHRTMIGRSLQADSISIILMGIFMSIIRFYPEFFIHFLFRIKFQNKAVANICASFVNLCFFYSFDFAYMRYLTIKNSKFDDIFDVYLETIHSDGLLGLYEGFLAYVIFSLLFRFIFYVSIAFAHVVINSNQALIAIFFILPIGPILLVIITSCTAIATQPLFTIYRYMITNSKCATESFIEITQVSGWLGLFGGGLGTIFKIMIAQVLFYGLTLIGRSVIALFDPKDQKKTVKR